MSASDGNDDDSQANAHAHGPPPPPEPRTPMWLPAVGALLFLTVGLVWALSTPGKESVDSSAIPAGSATAAATATATAPAAAPGRPAAAPPGGGRAAPSRDPHGGH